MNDTDLDRIAARLRDAERGTSFTCTDKDRRDAADAIAQLRAERDEARAREQVLVDALDEIASWPEGPEVNGTFDSPHDARTARDALAKADSIGATEVPR